MATEDPAETELTTVHGIRLAIFDLDGTLVDSLADLAFAVNTTLERHGWPCREIHEIKTMVGDGLVPLVMRAVPQEILSRQPLMDQVLSEASLLYTRHSTDSTLPYPDIECLLSELTARSIKCAILSNKAHAFTSNIVARLFPAGTFAAVQGEIAGIPKKPHPQAALLLAEKLGCLPASCILVGDSPHDMAAARGAGMAAFGAGWGYRSAGELLEAGAELVLSSPLELLDFI